MASALKTIWGLAAILMGLKYVVKNQSYDKYMQKSIH